VTDWKSLALRLATAVWNERGGPSDGVRAEASKEKWRLVGVITEKADEEAPE
jgi:hypothetical protein